MPKEPEEGTRSLVARAFTLVEDFVYVALGGLLAVSAVLMLADGAVTFSRQLMSASMAGATIGLLDRLLLTLMIVELLYTVQVSFREHAVVPEPFLIVALVAVVRRVLVLTAEFGELKNQTPEQFRASMIELGVLTFMLVAFVVSLRLLRNRHPGAVAKRD
jgi:uncharacterized membrane protein (DUF373 family)